MPTRYLKPGIRDSELIDALSPMAEILFYRLLVTVDDFGRFDASPSMLKSHCFPIRDKTTPKNCQEALQELAEVGLVLAYTFEGKPFLQVQRWDNVPRSKESKFPAFSDSCVQMYTSVRNPPTVLPVTETVTETKTVTGTETVKTPRKRSDPAPAIAKPDDVDQQVWSDWLQLRKAKKAPVTQTVLDGATEEAGKAGLSLDQFLRIWCRRGSQGLEASWLKPNELQQAGTAYSRHMDQRASELAPGVARRPHQPITLENEHVPILPSH